MDHFQYKNNNLHAEEVPVFEIAKAVDTPTYIYSAATLRRHYRVFHEAFADIPHKICFAMKCNSSLAVISLLGKEGAGVDVVSGGEIMAAMKAGIKPQDIVFSGVGKTHSEMKYALEQDIFQINVESEPELIRLNQVAESLGKVAKIAIRVNPDVDPITHAKISTGKKETKFGIDIDDAMRIYEMAKHMKNIDICGVSVHIGSQLTSTQPFADAFAVVASFVQQLRDNGFDIRTIDVGGGIGVPYSNEKPPSPFEYSAAVKKYIAPLGCMVIFEPGRVIAGNSGILLTKAEYVKITPNRNFLILDAGMNDLIRPAMYDAYHEIIPVIQHNRPKVNYDIVGPVCETGDIFAKAREIEEVREGELIAIRTAGAYGFVMANNYNARLLPAEVLVDGDKFHITRKRQSYENLWKDEIIPK